MITYIKKAAKTPETDEAETRDIVEKILKAVREKGDGEILRHYSAKFKNWNQKLILEPEEIESLGTLAIAQDASSGIRYFENTSLNGTKKLHRIGYQENRPNDA